MPSRNQAVVVGIDVGGSGVKGAPVDVGSGTLAGDRYRIATPRPASPAAVAGAVAEVAGHFGSDGPIGCTVPGVVRHGVVGHAPNLSGAWRGLDATALLRQRLGREVAVLNDADAAGLAEARFGAARDTAGVVVMITLGTGIGTAVMVDGTLVPNTELGHLKMGKKEAEERAAALVRERHGLSWKKWGRRVSAYLEELERLLWPDLFVIGGGVSRKFERFSGHLRPRTPVVPASLGNQAGIVGAALAAAATAA